MHNIFKYITVCKLPLKSLGSVRFFSKKQMNTFILQGGIKLSVGNTLE